jgi:hypothetical protein
MSLLNQTHLFHGGVDSSVDKVIIYGLENKGNVVRFPARETFLFPKAFRLLWENSLVTPAITRPRH